MKQLVAGTLVLSLIASNIITVENYIINKRKLDQKVVNQGKIIKNLKKNLQESTELDKEKDVKIHILMNELDKVKNDLDQSQKSLKQLKERKEVSAVKNKSYYEVTAYTSGIESTGKTPSDTSYRVTASGEKVQEGKTVACPPSIPFGTKLNIQNVGMRVCEDRGGAIQSGKLDLYVENLNKAIVFGRQRLLVEILS